MRFGYPPLGWTNVIHDHTRTVVAPGIARSVDLGMIPMGEQSLVLAIDPSPQDERHRLRLREGARYQIKLALTAKNADARFYNLQVEYRENDPEWYARPDVWQGLRISVRE